mmetsp:Transcript_9147/g.22327  ORF Transcript_9147/g.22327 Transcript_9147/m.22327 type:complete len:236 (+) Transcript_9147:1469-2176(+)
MEFSSDTATDEPYRESCSSNTLEWDMIYGADSASSADVVLKDGIGVVVALVVSSLAVSPPNGMAVGALVVDTVSLATGAAVVLPDGKAVGAVVDTVEFAGEAIVGAYEVGSAGEEKLPIEGGIDVVEKPGDKVGDDEPVWFTVPLPSFPSAISAVFATCTRTNPSEHCRPPPVFTFPYTSTISENANPSGCTAFSDSNRSSNPRSMHDPSFKPGGTEDHTICVRHDSMHRSFAAP